MHTNSFNKIIFFDVGNVLVFKNTSEGHNIMNLLGLPEAEYEHHLNEVVKSTTVEFQESFWDIRTLDDEIKYLNKFHEYFLKYLNRPIDPELISKLTKCRTNGDYFLVPGCIEMLDQLAKKFRLGIITNALPSRRHHELQISNLIKYFDPVIISWEVGIQKPDKKIYEIGIEKSAVSPENAIFIDDKPKFLDGAKAAGIKDLILFTNREVESEFLKFNDLNVLTSYLINL